MKYFQTVEEIKAYSQGEEDGYKSGIGMGALMGVALGMLLASVVMRYILV